ncbi:hypothetical protein CAC42_4630 [Sphaceloma murrayae]|uniref:Acyltransferase MbtK/IucB-like conserved domain-containing protein n=1 Tax=Sphaceloma murrayae TaxID=2082308 RepID=A0A2K1QNG9_9PEZI|nr:hypothetical protein CAC42_4630 [Sphaceloma murrayae]
MAPSVVHLPNGHDVTVTPVFGGLSFKASELNRHPTPFPPGWTIVIHSEDQEEDHNNAESPSPDLDLGSRKKHHVHRFREPTLQNDHLYISSISNPSSSEFKAPISPTRQIAMMLWTTLWWYFHQREPALQVQNEKSAKTVAAGRPRGEWKVTINREGIFKGKHLLQKLERMGLVITDETSVGADTSHEAVAETWASTYITRRHFWLLDARIYLFTLSPMVNSPFPSGSPAPSRPASPNRAVLKADNTGSITPPFQQGAWSTTSPFHSSSHLPTYFPPAPATYVWTGNTRHPRRPKAPRQGEIIYTRYIPSLGETLSFRVASLSRRPVPHSPTLPGPSTLRSVTSMSEPLVPTLSSLSVGPSDVELLHKWMNDPRVAYSWGEDGPIEHQHDFLEGGLKLKHSFPVIGCFDGKPFGYFEIYWVKEDRLGAHLGSSICDWDRGFHCLVGEQEFRGSHRVKVWLSALVHYCLLADSRTNAVMLEPRVDNEKLRRYCEDVGFFKEREITFPHKQSNLMKTLRETWESPCL